MKTKTYKIEELKPASYNPRVDLQEGDKEYEALKNSLGKFGLVEPIVVNEKTNTIIGGHQRINVLKTEGQESVEAVILDLDEQEEKELNLALNKAEGKWDFQKLDKMLQEMTQEEKMFAGFLDEKVPEFDKTENETAEQEKKEKPFYIYVSFDSKEDAPSWIEAHGLNQEKWNGAFVEME